MLVLASLLAIWLSLSVGNMIVFNLNPKTLNLMSIPSRAAELFFCTGVNGFLPKPQWGRRTFCSLCENDKGHRCELAGDEEPICVLIDK